MNTRAKTFQLITGLLLMAFSSCDAQTNKDAKQMNYKLVGGPCEGCEAVFEYGDQELNATDTLPDFNKSDSKIKISGTIYQSDGKTPAEDVILYVYHTNNAGIYKAKESAKGWGKRHGYNRGWVKTDHSGRYTIYTVKPSPYPNRAQAAHIHYTILEPNGKYYWLSSVHFNGDSLLTPRETKPDSPRGGTVGLLSLEKEGNLHVGKRDLILGRNIPNY
ncbi:intradiol ring-cleavage dioxygenase [Marivirga harenae]|uniref:dioxygenase family protein n=1 Tax=Marivirga harenae TaxID=2010992 RepID=UPI0026DF533C|nr:intradiol ring-cleavage dioxygenase [Marivirga harenae]WKV11456.1 intradiol ring-cleavage dioxygenase [Marivirga harenae]|tara:strand:- start:25859 stop:26512 length:654 start_codon:yes stop_codon:yes gene_type:complete